MFCRRPSIWITRRIASQPTVCVLPICLKFFPRGTSSPPAELLKQASAGSFSPLRGQFNTAASIGDVAVSTTSQGAPVYLRDLVQISRGYQAPAQYLNYYTWRDANGHWQRSRAITLAIYMRDKKQIARFGQSVNSKLSQLRQILPADLILAHTSDQPLQVKENIHLFMRALMEAIGLVVLVSLLGFWEWRLALIMALAIPITLAMTFGVVNMLGIDLQQVSIATLIIALGLLVDVPVVSGDGIDAIGGGFRAVLPAGWALQNLQPRFSTRRSPISSPTSRF